MSAAPPHPGSAVRHLRPRGPGVRQPVTPAELFLDLVYVFAVTQLSHLIIDDLSLAGVAQAAFLLLVVWWAWINTTWMANWFDPASAPVGALLTAVMLASLVMAAAVPGALGDHGLLFAGAYVALQLGRNIAAATLLPRDHHLRGVFERLVVWSGAAAALWLAGGALAGDARVVLWGLALAVELAAPAAGYWVARRGRGSTTDWDVEGEHFAERCHLFVIIALGESIVVTGATAADAGMTTAVLTSLVVAFLQTATLWWIYFGTTADRARSTMATAGDPGRLARDGYTYGHLPIVAGIIVSAVGADLVLAHPGDKLPAIGVAMVVGGPALFLLGESRFRFRATAVRDRRLPIGAALLVALAPAGAALSALALSAMVVALLAGVAAWERTAPAGRLARAPQ